jgi:quercetin dioxygenase-like cupin family protein
MSPDLGAREPGAGLPVIVNPLSGERIRIREPVAGSGVLAWELELAPGGRVPSSHAHPEQEERFTVLSGRMRFRVGRRRIVAGPGDTVRVPPGTVHHFANASPQTALVAVQTIPALNMQDLLQTAAALAQSQHAAAGRVRRLLPGPLQRLVRQVPSPVGLALFMHDFEQEVRAPYLPRPLVRVVTSTVARLATRLGLDRGYPRAKGPRRRLDRGAREPEATE